jgi:hypothetical protein
MVQIEITGYGDELIHAYKALKQNYKVMEAVVDDHYMVVHMLDETKTCIDTVTKTIREELEPFNDALHTFSAKVQLANNTEFTV